MMNAYLKYRMICVCLFVVVNFIYGGLVVTGHVGPAAAALYGVAGLLWAGKLHITRNQYRRRMER